MIMYAQAGPLGIDVPKDVSYPIALMWKGPLVAELPTS